MKRILFVFASVACVLAGCTLEPAERLLDSNAPVFTASFAESGATRTQLADNQTSVLWSEGDEISVFDGNKANREYVAGGAGKTTDFTLKGSGTVTEAQTWYALYPYNAQASFDGTKIQTSLPAEFTLPGPGTFADGMNIAVASSSSLSLPFKNVLGWIPVAIKGATGVTKLVFKGNADENVAGALLINGSDLSASLADLSLSKTITLNVTRFEESVSKEEAKYYYIPVVPQAFHSGFSIIITKADGDYTYTYDKDVTFARGEKRALFIEIPGGGGGDYIDLVNEPLQWTAGKEWSEHKLLPDTHADLAWAEWSWNNGTEEVTYPEGYPTFDINKNMNRIRCVWKNDAMTFQVPVLSVPAGKSIVFKFAWRGGSKAPSCWAVEACLDGTTWAPMTLKGEAEGTVAATYTDKDGNEKTAQLFLTKKDSAFPFEASVIANTALEKQIVKIRVRAIDILEVNGTVYATTPTSNSNCHIYIAKFTLGEVNYPGPNISIR